MIKENNVGRAPLHKKNVVPPGEIQTLVAERKRLLRLFSKQVQQLIKYTNWFVIAVQNQMTVIPSITCEFKMN